MKCPECAADTRLCQCPTPPPVDVAATVNGDMHRALFSLQAENRELRQRVAELERRLAERVTDTSKAAP